MSQPTVFDLNPALAKPKGRAAWDESFTPVLAELREALQARQPARLAALSGAEWNGEANEFRLAWLDRRHRITWPDLVAYAQDAADPCPANVQGLFLYYLAHADGAEPNGQWIAFRELPDGWLYHQAFQGYTGNVLVQTLGNNVAALAAAAQAIGGEAIEVGDCGYAFQVLPRIRLAVVYWLGDEEFAPQAQILFDAAASHYLPVDGLAMLGSDLVRRLLKSRSNQA